jgi:DNA-binding NtrC family response regulator
MANGEGRPVRATILVVDDDAGIRDSFEAVLAKEYDLLFATQGPEALRILGTRDVNLVLLDIRMPGMDGLEVLRHIKELNEQTEVVIVTAVKSLKTAIDAIKLGASDYITKPFDTHEILSLIKRVVEKQELLKEVLYLRSEIARDHRLDNLVGRTARMQEIYDLVSRIANNNATVLLNGESGTGKEVLVAKAVHYNSPRAAKTFVAVNCAAIPAELLESELFGHEKGAFTGAIATKVGKFELATGGTLFLDEIGHMRLDLQAKILRALQEREIERVGGTRTIKIDVRVLAATNRDLKRAIEEGTFREDLYYRLNVVPITLPPLRQRREDIPLLVEHFIGKYNREFARTVKGFSAGATAALYQYDWPGNVRELENVIERAVALAQSETISLRELPLEISILGGDVIEDIQKAGLTLREARSHFERQYILNILERVQWNQTEAARVLGLHRNTLAWKLQRLRIDPRPQLVSNS